MPLEMITAAQLKQWAPKAKKAYVDALLAGEEHLRAAGILNSHLTLCHFLGQVGAETNGLTILRESMNYTSVERIRQVWPARARKTSAAELAKLVGNPGGLACWAYGGRMGNAKCPSLDGYYYRGGGFLQTTGRWAVAKYCKALGVELTPNALDDHALTLRFACYEWQETQCGHYAEQNDLLAVSRIINTGSAKSGVTPNGMSDRKTWLRKAWQVWGDQREMIPEVSDITAKDLRAKGSETISGADLIKVGSGVGAAASAATGVAKESGLVETVPAMTPEEWLLKVKEAGETADIMATAVGAMKGLLTLATENLWVIGVLAGIAGIIYGRKIIHRRLSDARLALNLGRLG